MYSPYPWHCPKGTLCPRYSPCPWSRVHGAVLVVIVLSSTVPVLGPVLRLLSVPGTVRVHGTFPVFCSHCPPFMYSPCPWTCPYSTLSVPGTVRVHGTVPVFVVIVLSCTVRILGTVLSLLSVPGTVSVHGTVPVFCSHCPFMYSPCPWPCPKVTLCPRYSSCPWHRSCLFVVIVLSCTVLS